MRSFRNWLVPATLAGFLACTALGCGGGSGLEKPPETTKQVNPENDMPGFKDMQDKMKSKKR